MKKIMRHLLLIFSLLCLTGFLRAQGKDSVMLTIFLKHQQDKNLDTIQARTARNGFNKMFPPKSARVVSWYVLMGIGQVVTLKFPASELRNVNLSIEKGAWGGFDTEFYATYDYMPVWEESRKNQ